MNSLKLLSNIAFRVSFGTLFLFTVILQRNLNRRNGPKSNNRATEEAKGVEEEEEGAETEGVETGEVEVETKVAETEEEEEAEIKVGVTLWTWNSMANQIMEVRDRN